jgi:hypothetical protein
MAARSVEICNRKSPFRVAGLHVLDRQWGGRGAGRPNLLVCSKTRRGATGTAKSAVDGDFPAMPHRPLHLKVGCSVTTTARPVRCLGVMSTPGSFRTFGHCLKDEREDRTWQQHQAAMLTLSWLQYRENMHSSPQLRELMSLAHGKIGTASY